MLKDKISGYSLEDQIFLKETLENIIGWRYESIEKLEDTFLDIVHYYYNDDPKLLHNESIRFLLHLIYDAKPSLLKPLVVDK